MSGICTESIKNKRDLRPSQLAFHAPKDYMTCLEVFREENWTIAQPMEIAYWY